MNNSLPPPKRTTQARAAAWSRAVFARYGRRCYLHRRGDPRSRVAAVHAAHVIPRSRMGAAIAYGPKGGSPDPRLGRPLCYECHQRQEADLDPRYRFPFDDVLEAVQIHNGYAKAKLPLPDPADYRA